MSLRSRGQGWRSRCRTVHLQPAGDGGPDLARVLDTDIQLVVNGLFASGAEAVAVNGQRITVLSPIRSAGEAVLVGFRPLTPPYTVTAVGPDELDRHLRRRVLLGQSSRSSRRPTASASTSSPRSPSRSLAVGISSCRYVEKEEGG